MGAISERSGAHYPPARAFVSVCTCVCTCMCLRVHVCALVCMYVPACVCDCIPGLFILQPQCCVRMNVHKCLHGEEHGDLTSKGQQLFLGNGDGTGEAEGAGREGSVHGALTRKDLLWCFHRLEELLGDRHKQVLVLPWRQGFTDGGDQGVQRPGGHGDRARPAPLLPDPQDLGARTWAPALTRSPVPALPGYWALGVSSHSPAAPPGQFMATRAIRSQPLLPAPCPQRPQGAHDHTKEAAKVGGLAPVPQDAWRRW